MGVMDWIMIIFDPEEQQLSMITFFFFFKGRIFQCVSFFLK